jgi:REP element-mobilizing transposase RayT
LANKNVYVLDPCCGTGSYLVEVLDRIHRTLKERGEDALTASDLKEAAQKRVFGFEIMPAPFVVSHLQLGLLLQNMGAPLSVAPAPAEPRWRRYVRERVGVYLTNALTGWEPPKGPKQRLIFPELEEERDAAEHVKLDVPILVILGNPPYNSFAGIAKMEEERDLSEAYRTTKQAPAPQGQGLNDLYVRFFRMAERRIVEKTGRGVVCLISNYSWLDGLSFTGMRERYLEAFDRIWIDCLNGDKYKTGKLTPEGEPDPSVFSTEFNREGIQVGTAIALLVRNAGFQPAPGSRQDAGATDRGATAQQDAGVAPVPFRYESVAIRGRGFLPHWEMEGATYSVTFRLGDSLPQALHAQIEFERKDILKTAQQQGRDLTEAEEVRLADLHRRFDEALDAGYGACYLARPEVAEPVYKALRYFDGERYKLVAACVMPNHVHAVFAPSHGYGLENILHSWKSFTSKEANKSLGRTGQFWEREYFDRLVRDAEELERTVRYVIENPAKAGLENWNWVWIHDAFRETFRSAAGPDRTAGFQPAQERSRQDAGATEAPVVRFRHLWGKTKRQQLLESSGQDGKALYDELTPPLDLGLPFAPAQATEGYLQWPLLPDLVESSSPGVNTSRDLDLVEIDLPKLKERISDYFDKSISDHDLKAVAPNLMTASARYDPAATRRHLLERGLRTGYFVPYCYRPFDTRHVYWHPETKLIDEKREDLFSAFQAGNLFLTSRQKAERQIEGTPFYVTPYLSDRHLTRPGCNCFSLTTAGLPTNDQQALGRELKSDTGITANLSRAARTYLAKVGISNPDEDAKTASLIWMHSLAIGYSPAYLDENVGGIRQDWPRIPLPDSKEALLASAELGQQIAALLDIETPFVAPASSRQASGTLALQRIATFTLPHGTTLDEAKHFAVTAGWGHAGQGGVTMPGKGKIIERDYSAAERNAGFQPAQGSRQDAGATAQQDAGATLGDRTCDVYLNEFAYWSNIPLRVWEYTIGGYQVMKKWLSYREERLLGRPLTKDEVRYAQEMARRIAAILLLEPALDANYQNVKAHTFPWKG